MRLHEANEHGIFQSPLGQYDASYDQKWESMADFVEDIFTQKFPTSTVTEMVSHNQLTFEQLFTSGKQLASKMTEIGIERGTILHLIAENCLEWLTMFMASYVNGYLFGSSYPNAPWVEFHHKIQTQCATVVVLTKKSFKKLRNDIEHPFLTHVLVLDPKGFGSEFSVDVNCFPVAQLEPPSYDPKELENVCQFIFSSGTTGKPKAVKINHKMIIHSCRRNATPGTLGFGPESNALTVCPLSHVGGHVFGFLIPTFAGASIILGDYPGHDECLQTIERFIITHVSPVPAMINRWAKSDCLEQFDLMSLKYILVQSSCPNFDMIAKLVERSGNNEIEVRNTYGATETSDCTFTNCEGIYSDPKSIGLALPGISFKIIDLNDPSKAITEPGTKGQLITKEANESLLYFKEPEKTAEALTEDGFYKSGDIAEFDESFNVFITGRIKEVIKFEGFTISPGPLEDLLMEHNHVRDCAVVGKPDEESYEIPVAFVVLAESAKDIPEEKVANELKVFVANQVPDFRKIHNIYFINEIPRNANGKIMRPALVEKLASQLI